MNLVCHSYLFRNCDLTSPHFFQDVVVVYFFQKALFFTKKRNIFFTRDFTQKPCTYFRP
jgi:hypothetical protein